MGRIERSAACIAVVIGSIALAACINDTDPPDTGGSPPVGASPPGESTQKYVFVTADLFVPVNLGIPSSDELCRDAAEESGALPDLRGRQWVAWLSDDTHDAKDRVPDSATGWVLPDGKTKVAASLADLVGNTLDHGINMNQYGDGLGAAAAWTGTQNGVAAGSCDNWTTIASSDFGATVGDGNATDQDWSSFTEIVCTTDVEFSIYCFEQ